MGTQTATAWTDSTWNPVTGCTKVSSGCANCYAERLSLEKGWSAVPWTKRNARENVTLHPGRLDHPLRWRKPRRIFLCSMGDLFHELVTDGFIEKVFDVIARCPEHTFQLLTKRPARMAEFVSRYDPEDLAPSPLPNLWLGTSVENQAAAEARLPELLRCMAAVLFVSLEPLIAPVDLTTVETPDGYWLDTLTGILREPPSPPLGGSPEERRLGWAIVGGESGPGYRPMSHEWVRALRDQCITAEVPFFFKQSSGVRHNTGTLLDGEQWRQFPEP